MIPHSRPDLGDAEAAAAHDVVASGQVAQGREVAAFEEEVAAFTGHDTAVAVGSGTAALQLALQALSVDGRPVLMPSYVCTALAQATRAAGGETRLADVDGDTGNLDEPPAPGDSVAAIVPHMFGRPAAAVAALAATIPVVEDLAMALGSDAGCRGVAAIASFHATKVITSGGEGGMVLTDDEGLAHEVRSRREYDGLSLDRLRGNHKMTDVAAAVGRVQLRRLPDLLARRRELASRYDERLSQVGVRRAASVPGEIPFRYVVQVEDAGAAVSVLEEQGVAARRPVPVGLHRLLGSAGAWPGTDRLLERALSLPLYPSLSDAEAQHVVDAACRALAPVAAAGA